MHYFITAITTKYFDFKSRARRSEFWFVVLFNFLITSIFLFSVLLAARYGLFFLFGLITALYILWYLFMIIPSFAVAIRRLHDVGVSGWWILLSFIPFFGSLALLVFYFLDSQRGLNRWGTNPKGIS
ncbi:Inner membrane protein YhaI [bioreactor metagenome]|uniref:Inner membrane protein YhaI n=1 Tax=bioreactor metagenome TaxID=1076179 RepID=A0A644UA58_9ZZZZ|nr:DUF805 domain-containing protein [Candidatus Elulimicrobiales bacterium]